MRNSPVNNNDGVKEGVDVTTFVQKRDVYGNYLRSWGSDNISNILQSQHFSQ